jgi:hypothetical protein
VIVGACAVRATEGLDRVADLRGVRAASTDGRLLVRY